MVNCVDNEKLLKNIITQFCDQNFKFTLNLKILGSIHVQVDNSEVLTCLLDEKFFKSGQNRSLITTNQNLFNPLSVKAHGDTNTAFNLVTTLNQLQQQQQQQHQQQQQQQQQHQLKLVNTSQLSNVKMQSLSSSSSTSSSASSYLSGDCNQHKRKRSNGQKSDDGLSSSSASSRSRREHHQSDDEDEDEANSSDHNENENENEDNLNNSSSDQTPLKRNKMDEPDEAATAAANALSLISAAAVASKLYNQQNPQSQHNYHNIAAHLNPYQTFAPNSEGEQPGPSALAGPSGRPLKPKAKFLTNDYEQQLKQQIFQQSIENSAPGYPVDQEAKKAEEEHESSLEESQLYMDEENNKNDKENEEQMNQNGQQTDPQPSMHLQQQQQQLIMAAAAAAFMNNNSNAQQHQSGAESSNLKLFMPHNLALNLPKAQAQPVTHVPNTEKGKKKSKTAGLMSPSSNLIPHNGPISNKSSSSVSSASSCASTSSAKSSKKSRQTIAALAAAAAVVRPGATPNQSTDSQRSVQHGLKDTSNIDQIINEVTEKSKISTASPKPVASKHLKKHHLLSASVPHSPNAPVLPKKEKTKKSKANDAVSIAPNLTMNGISNQVIPSNQQNSAQAAAAAAAAALQYHHFLNNNLKMNSATPQKPNPKFHLANGGYVEEAENQMKTCKYEDADEEEPYDDEDIKDGQHAHLNGPLSIKSLTGPLTQSNTNTQSQGPNGTANMEFECTACEKKFKYYCYYKRHMDACHSDMPKYVCDTCNKSYKWEASFRQHLRSHHTTGQSGGSHEENGEGKYDGEENNENHEAHDTKENEEDNEEPDVGTNEDERIHPNERLYYERDHEHIGAAGTLASIAESLNGMHGRLMINNQMS